MKFRKRPVVIDAVQWNPTDRGSQKGGWPKGFEKAKKFKVGAIQLNLLIPTLEGTMHCMPQDWVIKGVKGEFYSCKPDIFAQTYEPA